MNNKRKEKRIRKEITRKMKSKLALVFFVIVLALLGLGVKVIQINKVSGDKYTKKVLAQQDSQSLTLPYRRGDIMDRNGTILATSEKVYNLILDPKVLLENQNTDDPEKDCVEPTIQALTANFELEESEIRRILSEKSKSSYVPMLKKLTKDEISAFEEAMNEKGSKIKGVWFEDDYVRKYPYNDLASQTIGYTVSGNVGQYGIEQQYSSLLNGTNGRSYTFLNEDLEYEKSIQPAKDGYSVVSTIDVTLQKIVEKYIAKFEEDYTNKNVEGPAAKKIAVLMMDPRNGEVLAMATNISYDLNNPFDLVGGGMVTEEQNAALTTEEREKLQNEMWRNFCISDGYEPGSTIKPMTIAGALDAGVISPGDYYVCDGFQMVGGSRIRCAKRAGHGTISLEGALMFSCNDALMQIAAKEGADTFSYYQTMFNFGLKTGIDLPGEANNAASVYGADQLGPTELATSSFGQSLNTTMIQVASAFSSVINGGYYYKPHVVKKVLDDKGGVVENIEGTVLKQTISEETSDLVKQYLYSTMYGSVDANGNSATGKKARVAGYAMGGKTGTAQKLPRADEKYLVSFIGFAPVDTPEVVCYVIVDEPNANGPLQMASSSYAQEIFKNIMKEALPYLNVYATEEVPADMVDEVAAEEAAKNEPPEVDSAEDEPFPDWEDTQEDPVGTEPAQIPNYKPLEE